MALAGYASDRFGLAIAFAGMASAAALAIALLALCLPETRPTPIDIGTAANPA
jgi:hypothetical protein